MEVGSEGERGSGGVCESGGGGVIDVDACHRRGATRGLSASASSSCRAKWCCYTAREAAVAFCQKKDRRAGGGSGSGGNLTVGCSEDVLLGLRGGKVHVRCRVVLLRVGVGHGRRSGAANVGKHISPKRKY